MNKLFQSSLLFLTLITFLIASCKQSTPVTKEEKIPMGQSNGELPILVASGKIERLDNFSSEYVTNRNIDIWLPANYDGNKKFNVLYMHDAQMLFDSTKTWNGQEWGVDEILSNLISKQHIANTIVVGIWNTDDRHKDYFPDVPEELVSTELMDSLSLYLQNIGEENFLDSLNSFPYVKFIATELKPYIDVNFSVNTEMKNTFIAGSSMGGLISMYALCEYPEVFGGAICMSTHWPGFFSNINNPIPSYFYAYMKENLPSGGRHKFYFDYGTETLDTLYEEHQIRVDALMVKKGYPDKLWMTQKFDGHDHSEKSWNKRLDIPMTFILGGP